jgi:uncharacterized protein (DUF1684 family)
MSDPLAYLELAEWRRKMARLYADVRAAPAVGRTIAWNEWRAARNDMFRQHTQSPLAPEQRASFRGLDYYPYHTSWRVMAELNPDEAGQRFQYQLGDDGALSMRRIAWVTFTVGTDSGRIALYWIEGYGGGLFLPFKDATSDDSTYGGGRYLFDTIKGADLGLAATKCILDFNYAYNPSCAYQSRWVCPLAPAENWLSFPVTAGEKRFSRRR